MVSLQKTQKIFCSIYAKLLQLNTFQFPAVLLREEFLFPKCCIYQAYFNLQFKAK